MREEFWQTRAESIQECAAQGLSKSEAAKKLGMSNGTITTYAQRYNIQFAEKRGRPSFDRGAFRAEAICLRDKGMTAHQAAKSMGLSYQTFGNRCRRCGVSFPNPLVMPNRDRAEAMASMYRSGKTLQEIGDLYQISRERVRQIINKHHGLTACDGGQTITSGLRKKLRSQADETKCVEKHGCSREQYRALLSHGKALMKDGVCRERTPIGAFSAQRCHARRRGIEWNLKLWDWWTVWRESGKWGQRGRTKDAYVMCRFGDEGPYELGNVYIASVTHNCSVQPNNPYRRGHPRFEDAMSQRRAA